MYIKKIIASGYKLISDVIAPPMCAYCKRFLTSRAIFCKKCGEYISPIVSVQIPVTARYAIKVFAISEYKDPLRSLILAKGYGDVVASRQLGELIWDATYIRNIDFDYIVPIPLYWQRYAKRGFNQAFEMAQVIAKKSGKPVADILKRIKKTAYQSQLNSEERSHNVKDAFSLRCSQAGIYAHKRILIVDDLMTTGATLRAAAKMLRTLRPEAIYAVVACRVL